MAISPNYPYGEIDFLEAYNLIKEASDCMQQQVRIDEGTWKERLSQEIIHSDSLNLRCTSTYEYNIHEATEEEPYCAMPCAGIVDVVENIN